MTSQEPHILRVDLSDFDNAKRYAEYSHFGVSNAEGDYRASIGVYSGNAGRPTTMDFVHRGDTICYSDSSYITNKVYGTSVCRCNNNAEMQKQNNFHIS